MTDAARQPEGAPSSKAEVTKNMKISSEKETEDLMRTGKKPAAKYKTKICIFWLQPGGCPYGDDCFFAHGAHELRWDKTGTCPGASPATNKKYKTRLCKHWLSSNGKYCPHGVRCVFAHGEHELRPSTPATEKAQETTAKSSPTSSSAGEDAQTSSPPAATSDVEEVNVASSTTETSVSTSSSQQQPDTKQSFLHKLNMMSDEDLLKSICQPQGNSIEHSHTLAPLMRNALEKVQNVKPTSNESVSKDALVSTCLQLVNLAVHEPLAFFERVSTLKDSVQYKEAFSVQENEEALEAISTVARASLDRSGRVQANQVPPAQKDANDQVPKANPNVATHMPMNQNQVPIQAAYGMPPPGMGYQLAGVVPNPLCTPVNNAGAVPHVNGVYMQQYGDGQMPQMDQPGSRQVEYPTTTAHSSGLGRHGSSTANPRQSGVNEEDEANFMLRDIFSAVNLSSGEEDPMEHGISRSSSQSTWTWSSSLQQQPIGAIGSKGESSLSGQTSSAFQMNLDNSPFSASLSPFAQEFEPFTIPLGGYNVDTNSQM